MVYKMDEYQTWIVGYLSGMKYVSELDDIAFRRVRAACEEFGEIDGQYFIGDFERPMSAIEFQTLEDCINMRTFYEMNKGYQRADDEKWHPQVTFPAAFVSARIDFKKYYPAEYEGRGYWITTLSAEQLI